MFIYIYPICLFNFNQIRISLSKIKNLHHKIYFFFEQTIAILIFLASDLNSAPLDLPTYQFINPSRICDHFLQKSAQGPSLVEKYHFTALMTS